MVHRVGDTRTHRIPILCLLRHDHRIGPSAGRRAGAAQLESARTGLTVLLRVAFSFSQMAAMPGNHTFTKRVEYTGLSYYYLGKRGYYFTQFFFQFSLAFNNMSSIIRPCTRQPAPKGVRFI